MENPHLSAAAADFTCWWLWGAGRIGAVEAETIFRTGLQDKVNPEWDKHERATVECLSIEDDKIQLF